RHLLFHFFGRAARPLCNHIDVVVGHVRIRLHRQAVKGNRSPDQQHHGQGNDHEAVLQAKFNKAGNHAIPSMNSSAPVYCSAVFCKTSALLTTSWPGVIPESSSCVLSGKAAPAFTSTRRNLFPPAGVYTQSRSCRWRIADEGTVAMRCFF